MKKFVLISLFFFVKKKKHFFFCVLVFLSNPWKKSKLLSLREFEGYLRSLRGHRCVRVSEHTVGGEPQFLLESFLSVRELSAVTKRKVEIRGGRSVLLIHGEHPREQVTSEVVFTSFAERLMRSKLCADGILSAGSEERADNSMALDDQFIHILALPLLNRSGRRHLEESGDGCWRKNARGVDINRNFDWNFGGLASSNDTASEVLPHHQRSFGVEDEDDEERNAW